MIGRTKASSAFSTTPALTRLAVAALGTGLLMVAALLGLAGTAAAPSAVAAGCPNESIRSEQGEAGLALPDCRAYEMVSPLSSSPVKEARGRAASVNGSRVTYASWNPFSGQENEGLYYVAERGSNGWTTQIPIPVQNGARTSTKFACTPSFAVTRDLGHVLLADGFHEDTEGEECFGDEPPLVPDEPRGVANIFRTDPAGTSYELVNRPPAQVEGQNAQLQGYNPDASAVIFTERAQLTGDAPEPETQENGPKEEDLYVWNEGAVRYVAYLPDGTPVLAHLVNGGPAVRARRNIANATHAISDDGERIFFEHQSKLYLREHALREPSAISGEECTEPDKACTIPIDTSEEGPSEFDNFGGRVRFDRAFLYAASDGSRVFFMDDRKLTPDSTAALPVKNEFGELINAKPDLYEYDVATGETTDLTVNASEPASVRGFAGASEDGSYVYFVAYANLTDGQQNSNGDTADAGRANLYLLHGGSTTYITTMAGGEQGPTGDESTNWQEGPAESASTISGRAVNTGLLTTSVSANGKFVAFPSAASLTGFDNTPAEPGLCPGGFGAVEGDGCVELFLYDAEANQLSCASCSPSGDAPVGEPLREGPVQSLFAGNGGNPPSYLTRSVGDGGAVFFDTPNPLLPGDVNGVSDVYEYEDGQLHLISTGVGIGPSRFFDASVDGSTVFFSGGQGLVGRDTDQSNSLYAARVNGGFPEPPPPSGCEGEACRGPATGPAPSGGAGTAHFSGPGNRKPQHKRDCDLFSQRASKLSKEAKQLRRQAAEASGRRATQLQRKAGKLAAKGQKQSKKAKTCRRENRRAGK